MTVITPLPAALALTGEPGHRLHLIDQDTVRAPHVAAGSASWKQDRAERDARNARFRQKRLDKVSAEDIAKLYGVAPCTVRRNWR